MSHRGTGPASFFDAAFRDGVKSAVAEIERTTSAEIVVVVRPVSGSYRHVAHAVGALVALVVLCVFLYHPAEFEFTYLPLELVGAYAIGAALAIAVGPISRSLASRRYREAAVELAASAAFADYGVHKTRGRTGILVLVSVFERRALLRPDVGVPSSALGTWAEALDASVRVGPERFLATLRELGPRLAEKLPRAADDINELPDDMKEAG